MITIAILFIVWDAAKSIFTRALDGIEPEVLEKIRDTAQHIDGVKEVAEVRARWVGHRLNAEVNIAVDANLSVEHIAWAPTTSLGLFGVLIGYVRGRERDCVPFCVPLRPRIQARECQRAF